VGLAFLGGLVEAEFGATPDKVTHTPAFLPYYVQLDHIGTSGYAVIYGFGFNLFNATLVVVATFSFLYCFQFSGQLGSRQRQVFPIAALVRAHQLALLARSLMTSVDPASSVLARYSANLCNAE